MWYNHMYLTELGTNALSKTWREYVFGIRNTQNTVSLWIPMCQFKTSSRSLILWQGRTRTCLIWLILVVWIRDVPLRLTLTNTRSLVGGAVGGGIALLKEVHHNVWVLILHDLITLSVVFFCFIFIAKGIISQLPALVAYCHTSPASCTLSLSPTLEL